MPEHCPGCYTKLLAKRIRIMKDKKEIQLGEEILIDNTIWAIVEEVDTDKEGNPFLICVDRIGGEHLITPERADVISA